jgi:hypothetical protein
MNDSSFGGISSGARMKSARPVEMAARGMPSNRADSSLWAITMPPASLIARIPRTPSLPVPDRMMPIDFSP